MRLAELIASLQTLDLTSQPLQLRLKSNVLQEPTLKNQPALVALMPTLVITFQSQAQQTKSNALQELILPMQDHQYVPVQTPDITC
jgi:hypothetical protein